jgi:hypothetical protein
MGGKFPNRADFHIPGELLDLHEFLSDALIDDLGNPCTIIYPPIASECPNCIYSPETGRSSDIYKTGGPSPFTNFTICPECGGEGRLYKEVTEVITMIVYWNPKSWYTVSTTIVSPDGMAQVIGYLTDLPKIQKAKSVVLNSDTSAMVRYNTVLSGEPQLWGFRQNRYFIAFMKRTI